MAVKIKKNDVTALVNLTPMIDMVFLLLIFFLVATRFEEEERSLEVQLPQASEAMPLTAKPKELFINIDAKGQYFVAGKFIDVNQLEQTLQQAAANNPGRQTVIIRADKRAVWQHVVTAMNLCNKANIRDYRVTTAEPGQQR
jgi:biopolymer transport protein ExbD